MRREQRKGVHADRDPVSPRGVVVLGAAAAAIVVCVVVLLWAHVPDLYLELPSPADRPDVAATREATRSQAIVTTRASLLVAAAGLGTLVTILINYRNSLIQGRTLATTQETFRVTERGHLTDRYTAAVGQLGDRESTAVRLGGVYALEQLVFDTTRPELDQATIVEVLSAFVRLQLQSESARPHGDAVPASDADVDAVISVLARLPVRNTVPVRADFRGVDFRRCSLRDARLRGGNLAGVELRRAGLAKADLVGVDLSRAVLDRSDLSDADLTGAILEETTLTDAILQDAKIVGADLAGAKLTGGDLTEVRATSSRFTDARLEGARLVGANLVGATLSRAKLDHADLTNADLSGAVLTGATFIDAVLDGANLTGAEVDSVTPFTESQRNTMRAPR